MSSAVTSSSPRSRASSRAASTRASRVRALLTSRRPVDSDIKPSLSRRCTACNFARCAVAHTLPFRPFRRPGVGSRLRATTSSTLPPAVLPGKGIAMKRLTRLLLGLVLGLALVLPMGASAQAAPYCGITWGSLAKAQSPGSALTSITNVRAGEHSCYDRMVIDVRGDVRGYSVRYVDQVYAEGSGAR